MIGADSKLTIEAVWGQYTMGQTAPVRTLAMGPDGRMAWSGGEEPLMVVWNLTSRDRFRFLRNPQKETHAIALSRDGKLALTAGYGSRQGVMLWDAERAVPVRNLGGHAFEVLGVAISPDGSRGLSTGTDGLIKVWNLSGERHAQRLLGHTGSVRCAQFSPDGKLVVSGGADREVRVWDLESGKVRATLKGHRRVINAVAFLPDGKRAVSASDDATLMIWDLGAGAAVRTLRGHEGPVTAFAVDATGHRAISASEDETLRVWDLTTGNTVHTLTGHRSEVWAVVLSPDGSFAVSGGEDHTIRVWDMAGGREISTGTAHSGAIRFLTLSPDQQLVSSGGADGDLRLWEGRSGKALTVILGETELLAGLFSGPNWVLSGGEGGVFQQWDVRSGALQATLQSGVENPLAVALTAGGRRAVIADDENRLVFSDLDSGKVLHAVDLDEGSGEVSALAASPDGRYAMAGTARNQAVVWNVETKALTRQTLGEPEVDLSVTAVAFSNGKSVAAGNSEGMIAVWNRDSSEEARTWVGHEGPVQCLVFSADGKWIVSGGVDRTIRVWNEGNGEAAARLDLADHGDRPSSLLATRDGRVLVGTSRGVILVLRLP